MGTFTYLQLINTLEDELNSLKQTINDSSLSCDKRIEIASAKVDDTLSNIDWWKDQPIHDNDTNELNLLKERAKDACMEYASYTIGKEVKDISFDSDYEVSVVDNIVEVGKDLYSYYRMEPYPEDDAIIEDIEDLKDEACEALSAYTELCEELEEKDLSKIDSPEWQEVENNLYQIGKKIIEAQSKIK